MLYIMLYNCAVTFRQNSYRFLAFAREKIWANFRFRPAKAKAKAKCTVKTIHRRREMVVWIISPGRHMGQMLDNDVGNSPRFF